MLNILIMNESQRSLSVSGMMLDGLMLSWSIETSRLENVSCNSTDGKYSSSSTKNVTFLQRIESRERFCA